MDFVDNNGKFPWIIIPLVIIGAGGLSGCGKEDNQEETLTGREKAINYAKENQKPQFNPKTDEDGNIIDSQSEMEKKSRKRAKQRNEKYMGFTADCANFVSQCLYEGGVKMNSEWYYKKYDFWKFGIAGWGIREIQAREKGVQFTQRSYNGTGGEYTNAWTDASSQYEYFSNPDKGYINGEVIHLTKDSKNFKFKDVQPGDLIYWDWYDEKTGIQHASMVSKVDPDGTIYFTAHSNDRFDELLEDHIDDEEIYIVRLKDCVFE